MCLYVLGQILVQDTFDVSHRHVGLLTGHKSMQGDVMEL